MIYSGLVSEISMEGKAEYHIIQEAEQEGQESAYDRTLLGTERGNRLLMEGHLRDAPAVLCVLGNLCTCSYIPSPRLLGSLCEEFSWVVLVFQKLDTSLIHQGRAWPL